MPDALLSTLDKAIASLSGRSGRLVVAYSGGLDSTVLLHLLAQNAALKNRLLALHVHHGLSANADTWAAHCGQQCAQLQVPFVCERVVVNNHGAGIEQAAREARYQAFAAHCLPGDTLLLAHHADDQAETFFMRLLRGSGLTGLAAMAAVRELQPDSDILLLRPLLSTRRAQLEDYAAVQQLSWVEDESNGDERFERNWWRQTLLPQIFARLPGRESALQRSIAQLQQDQQLLAELLQPAVEACLRPCRWPSAAPLSCSIIELLAAPAHHRPYLLRGWLARCGLNTGMPGADFLQRIEQEVIAAAPDRQPQLQLGDLTIRRFQQQLYLVAEMPPFSAEPCDVVIAHDSHIPWYDGALVAAPAPECGGSVLLQPGNYRLVAANACQGMTLKIAGRPRKTLKHLWQEAGVPPWLRECWPALLRDGELCALPGLCVAEKASAVAGQEPDSGVFLHWQGIFQAGHDLT
ncbi:tRNA lysidine(34) synthetase TilS [Thalassolituus hydrocarboniclasticus]|uniref:tRNA(Ile)-lysidine synthase n=1 Tax=Thalassolituus hydrocarboniclasticus TaxID=2742796 RepID=A0ABY6A7N7_9GAMM|nr:tRNA lysidine(34) synthetase TilS [Thalassolituus hydrocarboniclasticus]UXD86944.1 tRNA lysidine(34) synthetase TilS [Thalassolituus hydrocarboniclasticus]